MSYTSSLNMPARMFAQFNRHRLLAPNYYSFHCSCRIFLGWEGVEAEMAGTQLNVFRLEDYQVPYGYSPLLVAHPDTIR
jgi:hypothetical protein